MAKEDRPGGGFTCRMLSTHSTRDTSCERRVALVESAHLNSAALPEDALIHHAACNLPGSRAEDSTYFGLANLCDLLNRRKTALHDASHCVQQIVDHSVVVQRHLCSSPSISKILKFLK